MLCNTILWDILDPLRAGSGPYVWHPWPKIYPVHIYGEADHGAIATVESSSPTTKIQPSCCLSWTTQKLQNQTKSYEVINAWVVYSNSGDTEQLHPKTNLPKPLFDLNADRLLHFANKSPHIVTEKILLEPNWVTLLSTSLSQGQCYRCSRRNVLAFWLQTEQLNPSSER